MRIFLLVMFLIVRNVKVPRYLIKEGIITLVPKLFEEISNGMMEFPNWREFHSLILQTDFTFPALL